MLQREHSAIHSSFIKLPFSIKTFVMYILKWPLKTGFTLFAYTKHFCSNMDVIEGSGQNLDIQVLSFTSVWAFIRGVYAISTKIPCAA